MAIISSEGEYHDLAVLLHDLSRPRFVGSSGAKAVEERLCRELTDLGYEIWEYPFSLSVWSVRIAVPLIGATYLAGTLRGGHHLRCGDRRAARSVLLSLPPVMGGLALLLRGLVSRLPWGRVETRNILALPAHRPVRILVVAHRDSKSQPLSTHLRIISISTSILAWSALLASSIWGRGRGRGMSRGRWRSLDWLATGAAVLAGGALLLCDLGNDSPGALDNASGLAALLGLAGRERADGDTAFLLTDGEELWLAGAHSAVEWVPEVDAIVNLDGLDEGGPIYLIDRFGWPRRVPAPRLARAIDLAATELGCRVIRRGLPLGMLCDHLPFARAGHPAVTIMRGGRHSLRRVHRPTDQAIHLTGEGVLETIELVSAALDLIRGDRADQSSDCAERGSGLM